MDEDNFKFKMIGSGMLFFNLPNVGYKSSDPETHLPSILEDRLWDLSEKVFILRILREKVLAEISRIEKEYDPVKNELDLGLSYWDIVIYFNYFLYEARSSLDILASVLRKLYKNKLPSSFNKIDPVEKHAEIFINDLEFHKCLLKSSVEGWFSHLLSKDRCNPSIRDNNAHHVLARISIYPEINRESLKFVLVANPGIEGRLSSNKGSDIRELLEEIFSGVINISQAFKEFYPQKRIRELLEIPVESPGLYVKE